MNARTKPVAAEEYAVEISRVFDAPPILVFKAFGKPGASGRAGGARRTSPRPCEKLEFREGGSYRHCIHGPNGNDHGMSGVFREIVEPKTIVFTFAWDDENGEPGDETLITVTIRPEGKDPADVPARAVRRRREARDSHASGWGEVLDKLAPFLTDFRG